MPEVAAPSTSGYVSRYSIGGSDIGAILGVNRYKEPSAVFDRLIAVREGRTLPSTTSNDAERGNELEDPAARKYERETGHTVLRMNECYTHPEYPFLHANIDRLIVSGPRVDAHDGRAGVLEVKCPRSQGFRATIEGGVDPSYYAQMQHYLCVLGLEWGEFAFLNAEEWRLHTVFVVRDEEHIRRTVEIARQFWAMVESGIRPAPLTANDAAGAHAAQIVETAARTATVQTINTREWASAMASLRAAKAEFAVAETAKKQAEERVKALLDTQGLEAVQVPGIGKVTYKEETRSSFDKERLAQEHPELDLSRYTNRTATRVLRPTWGRE